MKRSLTLFFFIICEILLSFSFVLAGSILSSYKYAWSNNSGYINFEDVIVNDNALSGYAWSKNQGWIDFSPTNGGVLNSNGNLSGYAWGEQLGWIDFNNVSIDTSTGKFSGTATGTLIGILTFDCPNFCDVRTDWRPTCPTVPNAKTYNAYPTCGPASCNSGYIVSGDSCITIDRNNNEDGQEDSFIEQTLEKTETIIESLTPNFLHQDKKEIYKEKSQTEDPQENKISKSSILSMWSSIKLQKGFCFLWIILLLVLIIFIYKKRRKNEN
jgi:hypothetical protein